MAKWNLKKWKYVIFNWILAFGVFSAIYYLTPLWAVPWDWEKAGYCFLLYLGSGLICSIFLSRIFHYWKHWTWANLLVYRPVTALLNTTILAIGFMWLLSPELEWYKSFAWILITKLFVIGTGMMISGLAKGKVERKFAKDLLEVS
jgi:hypothetical protein